MGDSIERCISSIINQVDDTFEIIIVDDYSTDKTREVLSTLVEKYPLIKYKYLPKDSKRKLGFTRNYSFKMAQGEWCIFHIDADDIIGPNIKDFIIAVEALEKGFQQEKLFSGRQIHMARRSFLLERGPFRNIYRGEDRDLYERLALEKSWISINHARFIFRMERPQSKLIRKQLYDLVDQTITDLRKAKSPIRFIIDTWLARNRVRFKIILFKYLIFFYAFYKSRKLGNLPSTCISIENFISYRDSNTKSLTEWCKYLAIDYPYGVNSKVFF